jgi:hypothetical protein
MSLWPLSKVKKRHAKRKPVRKHRQLAAPTNSHPAPVTCDRQALDRGVGTILPAMGMGTSSPSILLLADRLQENLAPNTEVKIFSRALTAGEQAIAAQLREKSRASSEPRQA